LVVSRAKQGERREVIALLAARFPQCFSIEVPRAPLKIGIHAEILTALNGAIRPDQLQRALADYTSVPGYLRSIVSGASRCDLYGSPAGVVTDEEAAYANAKRRGKRRKAIVATTIETPIAAAVVTRRPQFSASPLAGPKRLSLADLRAAARLRRSISIMR
jgi:ProP effector